MFSRWVDSWRLNRERRMDVDCWLIRHALEDGDTHFVVHDLTVKTGMNVGRIYAALARLQRQGLVERLWISWEPVAGELRHRAAYRLTNSV